MYIHTSESRIFSVNCVKFWIKAELIDLLIEHADDETDKCSRLHCPSK